MCSQLSHCVPLPLTDDFVHHLYETATDWAILHGISMRSKTNFSGDTVTITPFQLLPTPFPRAEFNKAVKIQRILNELNHRVAHDYEFLKTTLARTIEVDEFTAKLFQIYETTRKNGHGQKISLGLLRSDYLMDKPDNKIKQVEFNTISCSFGALSSVLSGYHRFILPKLGCQPEKLQNIPENLALSGFATGLLRAWEIYANPNAAILFVVEEVIYNVADQRLLEFEVQKKSPYVRILRMTLTQIADTAQLEGGNRLLINDTEIAVIYFRSAYAPDFYPSDAEWGARLLMENSLSIKCPSIHYQLAGTKKVQQELCLPGVLERFLSTAEDIQAVREVFTGLYSLDMNDPNADKAIKMALKDPSKFVLKPQREGGGNNVYGDEIPTTLQKIRDSSERNAWILMDKIDPPLQKNYTVRPGPRIPLFADMISELGIFGVVIGDADGIQVNEQVGHMLRTKFSTANEGGVSAGHGALDNVYLV